MANLTVYADTAGGDVYGRSPTYTTARSTATSVHGTTYFYIGQYGASPNYYCYEGFLSFDTSVLGAGVSIESAVLSLYKQGGGLNNNFIAEARIHDWGATLTTADWVAGASLGDLPLVATFDTTGYAAGYNTFTDVALPANINKTGTTYIMVSSSRHRLGNPPAIMNELEFLSVYSSEQGTVYRPKIDITYNIGSASHPYYYNLTYN